MDFDLYIFTNTISLISMLIVILAFVKSSTAILFRLLLVSVIIFAYDISLLYIAPLIWQGAFATLFHHFLVALCLAFAMKSEISPAIILSGISFIIFLFAETVSYSMLKLFIPHDTPYDKNLVFSTYIVIIPIVILIRLTILPKLTQVYKKKIHILKNYAIVVINCYVIFSLLKEQAHKDNMLSVYLVIILLVIISSIYLVRELTDSRSLQSMILSHQYLIDAVQPIIQDIRSSQHDFRNQLNILLLRISSESDYAKTSAQLENLIEEIALVDSFTSFSENSVGSLLYLKNQEARSKKIQFEVNRPPFSTINHQLNEYELVSVLSNLIDNAIEATSKFSGEKKVIVSFKAYDNGTLISITNTGDGISAQTLSKLFKRNYSTKRAEEGTQHGYGLYNVKKILDQYGGKIEVLCEANLTSFQLYLTHFASTAS